MANIATNADTVGDVIDDVIDQVKSMYWAGMARTQREQDQRAAAVRAIEVLGEYLHEVWCPDADTKLVDVPVPQRTWAQMTAGAFVEGLVRGGNTNIE